MVCSNIVFLTLLVASSWNVISGSLVEINDTTFANLPPLYGLDEWSQCQRPGDVYCMVDAVLVSPEPSATLQLLQEYSQQNLKHYNRTMIHRGVCVTRCGQPEDGRWEGAAQRCVNQSALDYRLEARVISASWCSTPGGQAAGLGARALAGCCIALLALAVLATLLHVVRDTCTKGEANKYLLAFSLKRNWAILTYDRSKPRTDERMKDITCVEGIRFLGIQCVIFSHVLLVYIYSYIDNPQYIERMYDQFAWQAILNSPLWIQAFFSISGFLTAYAVIISTTEDRPFTVVKIFTSIINRWIRLTPLAVFCLWFTISWYRHLGAGPQWSWLISREASDCEERWWYHVLYVHNYIPLGKFCMGHTWYLAADMQLHVFGIIMLYIFCKIRHHARIAILASLMVGSSLAAGLVVYFYELTPIITAQSPEILRSMFGGSRILPLLYLPSWTHVPGYAAGVACACTLRRLQLAGVQLQGNKAFNILFHLSLSLGGCAVLAGAVFLRDRPPAAAAQALYAALDRTIVAVCFNVFLLGCFTQCRSALRSLLEWRGFHTLGRLSYCAFLIHFIVLRLTLASNTQLGHASVFSFLSLLITASFLTYVVSIPLVLLIELPFISLWKAMTERDRTPERTTEPEVQPEVPTKAFDLVSHIRRNQV